MSNTVMPEVGNLAWIPLTSVEEVEIFDRYNGVPTLGVFRLGGQAHLFWRALGYTGDVSVWLYVPLSPQDEACLENDEGPGLLDGTVFRSTHPRYVAVGIADFNRLIFEREWIVPRELRQADIIRPLAEFIEESLQIALDEGLPPTRRQNVQKAQDAVRHLVAS
jgi:hypothetical protein